MRRSPRGTAMGAPLVAISALTLSAALSHGCAQVAGIKPPDTTAAKQHCIDGLRDQDEEDIDCGGKDCLACGDAPCKTDTHCQSGTCVAQKCKRPSCSDGVFDGYESSLDCGDPRGATVACPLCSLGIHCWNGCNCESGFCDPSTNACGSDAPNCDRCADGVQETGETGVDCGGPCAMKGKTCHDGDGCAADGDCTSGHCDNAVCLAASCYNGTQDGDETGVDCGGSCRTCDGMPCAQNADCKSSHCVGGVCKNHCMDGMADEGETDVDCGGMTDCPRCADGKGCMVSTDCASGHCAMPLCGP